jgi:hypothetical protein
VLTALTLATLLAATPTGNARLDQGTASVTLRLTSFETERVVVRRGKYTSAELLYRSSSGDRLDLRFLFRGKGELPARTVTSLVAQTREGGLSQWRPAGRGGCRVKLYRAEADEVAGKVECPRPESGEPFEAVFDAKR